MKKTNNLNFKKTLSKFMTGITVVCVKKNNNIYGKTINSFNSVSLKPPLVLFSIGNYSASVKTFLETDYLSINILSNKQKNIAEYFAKNNTSDNKIVFFSGKNKNTSLIDGCVANLECKLLEFLKKGDHYICICKVMSVKNSTKLKPLSYYNSKYIK